MYEFMRVCVRMRESVRVCVSTNAQASERERGYTSFNYRKMHELFFLINLKQIIKHSSGPGGYCILTLQCYVLQGNERLARNESSRYRFFNKW